jgi:hypothetical protein
VGSRRVFFQDAGFYTDVLAGKRQPLFHLPSSFGDGTVLWMRCRGPGANVDSGNTDPL